MYIHDMDRVREVNAIFHALYPHLARQVSSHLQDLSGICVDIGPFGPGIGLALARAHPDLQLVAGDDRADVEAYLREMVTAALPAERGRVVALDKYALPLADGTVALVVFRGGLFFWDRTELILREAYRVLRPGGVAMVGGGYGAGSPATDIVAIRERSRQLNLELGKGSLTEEQARELAARAGLAGCARVDRHGGLWLVLRRADEEGQPG